MQFAETMLLRHTYTDTGRMRGHKDKQRAKAECVSERGLFLGRST